MNANASIVCSFVLRAFLAVFLTHLFRCHPAPRLRHCQRDLFVSVYNYSFCILFDSSEFPKKQTHTHIHMARAVDVAADVGAVQIKLHNYFSCCCCFVVIHKLLLPPLLQSLSSHTMRITHTPRGPSNIFKLRIRRVAQGIFNIFRKLKTCGKHITKIYPIKYRKYRYNWYSSFSAKCARLTLPGSLEQQQNMKKK